MTARIARAAAVSALVASAACARHAAPTRAPDATLVAPDATIALRDVEARARFTVVTFFSAHCPCQAAHDARLRELAAQYRDRGVAFLAVDSEAGATPARDAAEARARGYPFPLAIDPGGALARALGAEFATWTVILDRDGNVLFRGGIDSDRTHLTEDTHAWLRDALDDLLAGRTPRVAESEALGCTLTLR